MAPLRNAKLGIYVRAFGTGQSKVVWQLPTQLVYFFHDTQGNVIWYQYDRIPDRYRIDIAIWMHDLDVN